MDLYYFTIFACFAFALGTCVASFLNVCIWRLPRGESVVRPASHCPRCNAPIRWYQNIPVLSWCCLRGRCANCHEPISMRYVVVELMGGSLFLLSYLQWAMPAMLRQMPILGLMPVADPWVVVVEWLVVTGLMLGSFIDLDHFYLPDRVTIGGMVLGVAHWAFRSIILHSPFCILHSIAGLAFGFGLLWLIRFFGSRAFKREAMGMGDVFLMGAVGALFGPVAVLVTLILSSVFGSVVGLSAVALSKTRLGRFTEIPYGPYICLGCLVWMFWGPELVKAYMEVIRQ